MLGLVAFLVDGGQLDIADVGAVQGGLADALDVIQVLIVAALGAVEEDLRQARFRVAGSAPLFDLLLRVDLGEALRVLQIQHRQRDQGVAFALGGGALEQAFGLFALGLGAVRFGYQQAAKAGLGPRRGAGGGAVGGFGLLQLRRVARGHLNIGQADLRIAVAEISQSLVVALGSGGVATLERFVGQALIGQAGAATQGNGDRQ